jgi:hypothetical protein
MMRAVRRAAWCIGSLLVLGLSGCVNPLLAELAGQIVDYKVEAGEVSPGIDVKLADTLISPGGFHDFGSVQVGSRGQATAFTISNPGEVRLKVLGISLASGDTADFELDLQGTALIVDAGTSTTFSVRFSPGTGGARSAVIRIVNSNLAINQGEYSFELRGTATAVPVPDISVSRGSTVIPSGTGTWDLGDVSVDAVTDTVFTITNAGNAPLTLTGNPYKVSATGTDFSVSFAHQPTSPVAAGGGTAAFTVSFDPAGLGPGTATITIPSDDPDGTQNPYTFTIKATAKVKGSVLAPNGGEAIKPGATVPVTWIRFDSGGNVQIDLYKDGAFAATIAASTADASGSYNWSVGTGLTHGTGYKVRITNLLVPAQVDESDGPFAIGTLSGVSPAGGAIYKAGASASISWISDLGAGNVDIQLLRTGAVDAIIATGVPQGAASYPWTVPAREGRDFRIRVVSSVNAALFADSGADFAIGTSITGVTPSAIQCAPGTSQPIAWSSEVLGTVKLELLQNDVVSSTIVASTANDGSYAWTVPALSGTDFRVRVTSVENSGLTGQSAGAFAIGAITVTSPNGGQAFERAGGTPVSITWSSVSFGTVTIELLKGGLLYRTIAAGAPNGGSYTWDLASDQDLGNDFTLRVTADGNALVTDTTDAAFAINGWTDYGNAFSWSSAPPVIAVGNDGRPYVAVIDESDGYRCKVVKWSSGTTWTSLGAVSSGAAGGVSIVTSADSTPVPFVVYADGDASYRARVKRYVGSSWTDMGLATAGGASYPSIALASSTQPVVAYKDASSPYYGKASTWNGSAWAPFSGDFYSASAGNLHIVMKEGGEDVFIAYSDSAGAVKVKTAHPGGSWLDAGFPATGSVGGDGFSIALDTTVYNGAPVVAYRDPGASGKIRVYSSSTGPWTDLGYASADAGEYPRVAVDASTGYPVVAYRESGTSKIRLKKYNGTSWTDLGTVPGAYNFLYSIACEPTGERMVLLLVWQSGGYNPERVFRRVVY